MTTSSTTISLVKNLDFTTSDVYYSIHVGLFKPDYDDLMKKLLHFQKKAVREKSTLWKSFPSVYQSGVLRCFIKFLLNLGYERFDNIFRVDSNFVRQKNYSC